MTAKILTATAILLIISTFACSQDTGRMEDTIENFEDNMQQPWTDSLENFGGIALLAGAMWIIAMLIKSLWST